MEGNDIGTPIPLPKTKQSPHLTKMKRKASLRLPCDHDGRAGARDRPLHGTHRSGEALHHPRHERGREERRQ